MSNKEVPIESRINNPRERIYLPEILAAASKEKAHARKIALLRAYANKNQEHFELMRDFIQSIYHPAVVLDLPDGTPPYKTEFLDYNMAPMQLRQAFSRIPYFVKGHSRYIKNPIKREQVFIQTLEGMYREDAELFIMIKEKKFNARRYKTINEAIFREALPNFFPPRETDE